MNRENLANRKCPVCAASDAGLYFRKAHLALVKCQACAMIYLANPETEFETAEFYEGTASAFYVSEEKLAGDYSPVRYRREIGWLRKFCTRGTVLDVGCSTGGFLYYLRERFPRDYRVFGNDVAPAALDVAEKKGIPILREEFFGLDPDLRSFDAITFWAVLEHVANPREFLQHARRLLAPGGHIFILVPNCESLAMRLLGARYRYVLPQHLNYFSGTTLRRLVADAGFEPEASTTIHFNPAVIVQDFRQKDVFVPDESRARLLRSTNLLKQSRWLAPIHLAYSGTEKILGRFGLADNLLIIARARS